MVLYGKNNKKYNRDKSHSHCRVVNGQTQREKNKREGDVENRRPQVQNQHGQKLHFRMHHHPISHTPYPVSSILCSTLRQGCHNVVVWRILNLFFLAVATPAMAAAGSRAVAGYQHGTVATLALFFVSTCFFYFGT